jgi:hypothetical protein
MLVALTRCLGCGELRGGSCLCLCEGLICASCRESRIHRPVSAYYDEETGQVINVPHFAALKVCRVCGAGSLWEVASHTRG